MKELFKDPKRTELIIDSKFLKRMDRWCKKNYVTRSALIRRAVDWFLNAEESNAESDKAGR